MSLSELVDQLIIVQQELYALHTRYASIQLTPEEQVALAAEISAVECRVTAITEHLQQDLQLGRIAETAQRQSGTLQRAIDARTGALRHVRAQLGLPTAQAVETASEPRAGQQHLSSGHQQDDNVVLVDGQALADKVTQALAGPRCPVGDVYNPTSPADAAQQGLKPKVQRPFVGRKRSAPKTAVTKPRC